MRVVCLNCMDGRVQIPAIECIKQHFNADNVDMITEPGMDGLLAGRDNPIDEVVRKARFSVEGNDAKVIVVAGHYDCKGNSVNEGDHKEHIQQAVKRLKEEIKDVPVKGIWINSDFVGEVLEDE